MSIETKKTVAMGLIGLATWACTGSTAPAQMMRGGRMGVNMGGARMQMSPGFMVPQSSMAARMMSQPMFGGFANMGARGFNTFAMPYLNMSRGGYGMGGSGMGSYGMGGGYGMGGSGMGGGSGMSGSGMGSYGMSGYGTGSDYSGMNSYASGSTLSSAGSRRVEVPHPTGGVVVAPANAAVIRLHVPDKFAVVSFNGQHVSSIGTTRSYVTPDLQAGKSGRYEIRATWGTGNQHRSMERVVEASAGQISTVDFNRAEVENNQE
jgi:uncharacterized protein (TIGR03000 family)